MTCSRWKIRISDIDHALKIDDAHVKILDIKNIFKHSKYQENIAYFDVAVVQTRRIKFSLHIRPICLPLSEINDYDSKTAHLIGWGSKSTVGTPAEKLQRIALTVFPQR